MEVITPKLIEKIHKIMLEDLRLKLSEKKYKGSSALGVELANVWGNVERKTISSGNFLLYKRNPNERLHQ